MSDAPKFDLATSEGGRGYLAHLFRTHLKRHDFTQYIGTDLAADFACVMSRFVHTSLESEAALREALTIAQQCNAELEKELGPTIDEARATKKAVAAALAPGEGRCTFDVLWKSGSSAIDATITQDQYAQILRIISPEASGISEGFRAAVQPQGEPHSWSYKLGGEQRFYPTDPRLSNFGAYADLMSDVEPLYRQRAEQSAPISAASDPCAWTDVQVLEFLGVALRNVDLVGEVRLSEIRQGFEYMRDKAVCLDPAPAGIES